MTNYNDAVVKHFTIATLFWGIIGMLVGVVIAAQLTWPELNFDISWLTYSRIRPLHTNAVIFAFGGNALIGTSFYIVQRTCQVGLISNKLAKITFWGYQAVIVGAVFTLPFGYTQSKEYAELIWPLDVLLTLVWVCYGIVYFGTIMNRKMKHIYVANWFFSAFIITIAVLHIVNNLAIPVNWHLSYPVFSGSVDALTQW